MECCHTRHLYTSFRCYYWPKTNQPWRHVVIWTNSCAKMASVFCKANYVMAVQIVRIIQMKSIVVSRQESQNGIYKKIKKRVSQCKRKRPFNITLFIMSYCICILVSLFFSIDLKMCRKPDWFQCSLPHGPCLSSDLICNGIENCPGGEDELDCVESERGSSKDFGIGGWHSMQRNCSQYEFTCQSDRSD